MVVKSNNIFSPQNYLEIITGNCYFFDLGVPILEQINKILRQHKRNTKSYPLKDTPKLLNRQIYVVLVDCSDVNDEGYPVKDYRWFRVPMDYKD